MNKKIIGAIAVTLVIAIALAVTFAGESLKRPANIANGVVSVVAGATLCVTGNPIVGVWSILNGKTLLKDAGIWKLS